MKKKIIYLHGNQGAGKTSTADLIAEKLGYSRMSVGSFFRQEAEERGMEFVEFNKQIKGELSVDLKIDKRQEEFIKANEEAVMDGRIGFYLAPGEIFNVFLKVKPEIAAERIFKDKQNNPSRKTEGAQTIEETLRGVEERKKAEKSRYKTLYDIEDPFAPEHFDLIVDTGENNMEEVASIIIDAYKKWLAE